MLAVLAALATAAAAVGAATPPRSATATALRASGARKPGPTEEGSATADSSSISAARFGPAASFTLPFWSAQPLGTHTTPPTSTLASEYNSALMCNATSSRDGCMFAHDDEWVGRVERMLRNRHASRAPTRQLFHHRPPDSRSSRPYLCSLQVGP